MIKSISYDQGEIIKGILDLHVKNHKIDCDSTYSVGNFYKNTGIEEPIYKFDIKPQIDGVKKGDSRNLPLEDCSIECLMFDHRFLLQQVNHWKKTMAITLLIKDLVFIRPKKNYINFTLIA